MDLQGARAIVTGGASGIGAACVAQLREAGARVVCIDLVDAPEADGSVCADVGEAADRSTERRVCPAASSEIGAIHASSSQ